MATEPNLRHLFDAPQSPAGIDVEAVVRRSRARRAPKMLGALGVSALAIGGLVFGGIQVGLAGFGTTTASDSAGSGPKVESGAGALDSARAPYALELAACGAPVASTVADSELTLAVSFPTAVAPGESVEGTVTLTNTGAERLTGQTGSAPAIALSRDNVVVWHSAGPPVQLAVDLDLEPGESVQYTAAFDARACSVDDDSRTDLPAAEPGQYQVSAAIDFTDEHGDHLVTGPAETITVN